MFATDKKKRLKRYVLASVTVFLIITQRSLILATLNSCVSCLAYPILLLQRSFVQPIKNYSYRKRTITDLQQHVAALEEQHELLQEENIALKAERTYTDETDELVIFKKRFDYANGPLAQILSHHLADDEQYILVNGGKNRGVEPDMVAVYRHCLLGKVTKVYPYYSKVMLTSDKRCKVAAYCWQTNAPGIHEGTNKNTCSLNHVSHLQNVQHADIVLSSGQGLIFPAGFALGKVAQVEKKELYHDVTVEPLLDIKQLKHCYIIQKGQESIAV